ncbi:MAG: hypothetical protein KBD78_01100 [Oligoflexales bacterium]|nr:hypothetical protein [Oligoflexales bacterium]
MPRFSPPKNNLVILSAAKFEAVALLKILEEKSIVYEYLDVGVGALESAKSAVRICDFCQDKDVIFIGSCGIFGLFKSIELVQVATIKWQPAGDREGISYSIENSAPDIEADTKPNSSIEVSLPKCTMICAPGVSLKPCLAYEQTLHCESLELYSLAAEIMKSCASFTSIFAITNAIGPDAHQQWKQNFNLAYDQLAKYAGSLINGENLN